MNTTPIGNYKFSHKLHPLSLLAQLTSRRATGCLKVFTGSDSWLIYLEDGKLTYASYSEKLLERFDNHLRRLSLEIPTLNSATRVQVRLMFENKNVLVSQVDYQAICWLVKQNYMTQHDAVILIEELAKETLESFLTLKEGSYEFNSQNAIEELPKFCYLDLRLLVDHCQKQLRRQNTKTAIPDTKQSEILPTKESLPTFPAKIELEEKLPIQRNIDNSEDNNHTISLSTRKNLYTVACIDDSPTVLNSIKRFLDENTFSVVMINDPVKALMQILRSKPDLILLDVEMPNLDGYELCSLLRRHSTFKDTPIIMVTGRTGFIDRAKAKMVRSSGYLTKPFTQSDLLKMVFKHIA